MSFQWNEEKREENLIKHGVDFADTVGVFYDPYALTIEDDYEDEERFNSIGEDYLRRIIVVTYTWRGKHIRIISARKAEKSEVKQYVQKTRF